MEEERPRVLRLQPQDLVCTVCFSYYVHPSTLPCGHTFCRVCLEKYWAENARCNCPLCQKNFTERPELNKNTDLSALLDALQAHERCPSCTRAGALRPCPPCGAPLCQDPTGRQRHLLVNLITAPWPCMQPDRGPEYFRVSDSAPLCPACAAQHEECHPVHLLELCRKKQEIMRKSISDMEEGITSKQHIINRHKDAYRQIQILISDIKDNLTQDFREMRDYLEKQERAAFWRMKQEYDTAQRETSQLVQKLIADLDEVQRQKDVKSEEIFTTSASRSPHTFDENRIVDTTDAVTQMKMSLLEATPCLPKQVLEDSLELSSGSSQAREQEISASLQVKPCSRLLQWATLVSFDRDTVSCRLSISSDLKTVTVADKNYSYPKNERRFPSCQALCSEGFFTGCAYWEVSTADSDGWGVGVAASEISKSRQLGDSNLSWCVKWNKEHLSAWHKNEEIRIPLPRPSIVGVLLDCTEKLLSFYSVSPETEILIYTFRVHFQTCLFPAVWLYGLNKGKSLTIRDIKRTDA